jgi:hypothetical protein
LYFPFRLLHQNVIYVRSSIMSGPKHLPILVERATAASTTTTRNSPTTTTDARGEVRIKTQNKQFENEKSKINPGKTKFSVVNSCVIS